MTKSEKVSKFVLEFYGKYRGNFLEVGSGHPVIGNVTYELELCGWSGICIEPITKFNDEYKVLRKNCIVENFAMVSNLYPDKYIKTYVNKDENLYNVTGLGETNLDDFIFWPTSTVQSLLKLHNIKTIDFFYLDTLGYEHEVLKGIDFNQVRFAMILIKIYDYSWDHMTNDFAYLRNYGYSFAHAIDDGLELWINDALPVLERPIFKSNL